MSESTCKLINRIPGSRLLISSLPGSSSLTMSTSVFEALPGKIDIKRHSPSILYILASLAMSTSVLEALPGKLDIKRHAPSILNISVSLGMSTSVLKALPGKVDIVRHSPSILYITWLSGAIVVYPYNNCLVIFLYFLCKFYY